MQLERLQKQLQEKRWNSSATQLPGLTKSDGKPLPEPETVLPPEMLISSLPATLGQAAKVVLDKAHGLPKEIDLQPNTGPKPHSKMDKARLSQALSRICALQQQFGKTAAELETLVEGFCWILSDYTMDAILGAIAQFVKKKPQIPTPSDIEAILNPPLPKPDWAAYVALKKSVQEGNYLMPDERRFLRECEEYAKKHHDEEMDNYRTAQSQIDQHLCTLNS
jgi:hypothetical protein